MTRMTAGTSDQIKEIIDQGAILALIRLLKSGETQLIERVRNIRLTGKKINIVDYMVIWKHSS